VKGFLSTPVDHYRPSYGREARDFPRQCVLIGTTNAGEYLSDGTGNRRFWPIRCGRIDVDALHRKRDQLFAEAVVRYNEGAPWWVDVGSQLGALCATEQLKRIVPDPWEPKVADYLKGHFQPVTVTDVFENAIGMRPDRMNRGHANKVSELLR
jgi:predicted P-loop ATPase